MQGSTAWVCVTVLLRGGVLNPSVSKTKTRERPYLYLGQQCWQFGWGGGMFGGFKVGSMFWALARNPGLTFCSSVVMHLL